MKITEHSKSRITGSAAYWGVKHDFFDPMFRYLIYGLPPGSFFTAVLANDLFGAVQHSHPSNSISDLKLSMNWVVNTWPKLSWGSYGLVDTWCNYQTEQRRELLIEKGLIFDEETEIILALKGEPAPMPILY